MSALALHDLLPAPADLAGLKRHVLAGAAKRPAVYEFLDARGAVIYVGKAKSLRARLLSYFTAPWPESKAGQLIRCTAAIRWRYVPSEFAALLEELRLIQSRRPAYNVRSNRTRASLAFLKMAGGSAGRIVVTTAAADRAGRYYGPFHGRGRTLEAVRTLNDLLGLRDCAERQPMAFADQASLFDAGLQPACIRHEIGTCLGPCAARCTADRYAQAVRAATDFLEGRSAHPLDVALEAMRAASDARDFERAARWRDRLDDLTWLFGAVARLRAAVDGLTFVYDVPDDAGPDHRLYLIRHGLVRAAARRPRTPIEREAFTAAVRQEAEPGEPASARSAADMAHLLLVMSWFRQHPEEYERTSPLGRWTA